LSVFEAFSIDDRSNATTTTTTDARDGRARANAPRAMRIEELDDDDAPARGGGGADADADADAMTTRADAGDADDETSRRRRRTTAEMREEVRRLRAMRQMVMDERADGAEAEAEAMARAEPKYYESRELEYTNGDAYVGECVDDTRHGRGRHVCSTGDVYDGGWRDDKRHGVGTMTFASGLTYEGEWVDDKTCGRGRCAYVNGDAYDGEWKNDHRWGWGTQTFANGDSYEGEWVDDVIEGRGLYTFADGASFNGSTLSGRRVRGRYVTKDGSVEYDGEWDGDARHGRGKYVEVGSFKYIGQWRRDLRHGRGKCEFATGATYDGEWRDDAFHGEGELKTSTFEYVGGFESGKKKGDGVMKFRELGGEYRGAFDEDLENGKGKRLYADGAIYRGEWRDGKRHGKGACAYANGDEYQGEWSNDERHGYGVCVFADGTKFRGEWERDCWCQSTADPVFTKVFGPGAVRATAGAVTMVGIEARDELKNKRLSGGDIFTVRLTHLDTMNDAEDEPLVELGTVQDNGDGTYVAYYTCTVAGSYSCEVLIGNDEQCGHSPYDVFVSPSRVSPKNCVVEGEGTRRARIAERAEFTIKARDEFDNDVMEDLKEQLPLQISISDVSGREMRTTSGISIEDDSDGRLVISYQPEATGFYRLVISCKDTLMGESPYALRVSDGENGASDIMADAPEGSIAPAPPDLARDWEIIAKSDFARDGDDFGWDTASEDDETPDDKFSRENPNVPVVSNYEDLYKVGRLQKRIKQKRAEEQAKKIREMKKKLEALSMAQSQENRSKAPKSLVDLD